MYFTQISKDGEVLVPVPEFTFEDVKSLKDYNEAKNFRIETAPNGDEYVACRHVDIKKFLTDDQLRRIAQYYLDFFGKIRCEQEHHSKGCLREIKV